MNREEILSKAQQEGKGLDLPDMEAHRSGVLSAFMIGFSLLALVGVVNRIVLDYFDCGMYFAMISMQFVLLLTKYKRLGRKRDKVLTILFGSVALLMLVSWILQLTGVFKNG